MNGFRGALEEIPAEIGQCLVFVQRYEEILIFLCREKTAQQMCFEKAEKKIPQENGGLGGMNQAQKPEWNLA